MKRIISYVVLIIIFTSLGVIGILNKKSETVNENILNKEFYKYNKESGEHEILKFEITKLNYNGSSLDLNNCDSYKYNKVTNIINTCNKSIRIVSSSDEQLVLNINNKNHYFYTTIEKSYDDEFQKTFQMTEENYKKEGEELLTPYKIDYNKLIQIFNSNIKSYIYFTNDSNESTLFNKSFLSITASPNKYVLNINELTKEQYDFLKANYTGLLNTLEEYTSPYVIEIQNREVSNLLKIEIKGFNVNVYDNYFDEVH